jgi:hypothetical protein
MTWAEDRAPVGTDPSADPGAKTEGRAASLTRAALPSLRDWRQCDKSQGVWGTGPPPSANTAVRSASSSLLWLSDPQILRRNRKSLWARFARRFEKARLSIRNSGRSGKTSSPNSASCPRGVWGRRNAPTTKLDTRVPNKFRGPNKTLIFPIIFHPNLPHVRPAGTAACGRLG